MTVEGGGPHTYEESQTKGFLFADVRGYTEYLERDGASAAAELLTRYRTIVRAAIADQHGAEIRTEGDSFFVVLPSASSAVRCGLSIVERVDAENARLPAHAIRVGIGVHAGEAIETAEGLVGSAVNIASRLSAMARPGEVLVSETVRTLTRSVLQVRYVPRGKHRLKGVAEPQSVFAAISPDAAAVRVKSRWPSVRVGAALATVGLVVAVSFAYGAISVAMPGATPSPTSVAGGSTATPSPPAPVVTSTTTLPSPPASPSPSVPIFNADGSPVYGGFRAVAPGEYRLDLQRPVVQFEIKPAWTDRSWHPLFAGPDYIALAALPRGRSEAYFPHEWVMAGTLRFDFVRLQAVIGNNCNPGDTASYQFLGGRPRDVLDWLQNHHFLSATNIQPVTVAGWIGYSVDVTIKGDPGRECGGITVPHQGSATLFKTTAVPGWYNGVFQLHDGDEAQFVVLDVGQETPLVLVSWCGLVDCPKVLPWGKDLMDTMTAPE